MPWAALATGTLCVISLSFELWTTLERLNSATRLVDAANDVDRIAGLAGLGLEKK